MSFIKRMEEVFPEIYGKSAEGPSEETWAQIREVVQDHTRGVGHKQVEDIIGTLQNTENGGLCVKEMAERCGLKYPRFHDLVGVVQRELYKEAGESPKTTPWTPKMVKNHAYKGLKRKPGEHRLHPDEKAVVVELCQAKLDGLEVTLTDIAVYAGVHNDTVTKIYRGLGGGRLLPGKSLHNAQEAKPEDKQAAYEVLKKNVPESRIREVLGPGWPRPQSQTASTSPQELVGNSIVAMLTGGTVEIEGAHLVEYWVRSRPIPKEPLDVLRRALV